VYVYCILAPSEANTSQSDMTFFIDTSLVGTFSSPSSGSQDCEYNFNVYANKSLPLGNHTITIQSGRAADEQGSSILLDYITYSFENGSSEISASQTSASLPTSSLPASSDELQSSSPRGKIVGAVFGVIGFLLLAGLGFLWYRRSKQGLSPLPFTNASLPQLPAPVRNLWERGEPASAIPPRVSRRSSFHPSLFVGRFSRRPPSITPLPAPSPAYLTVPDVPEHPVPERNTHSPSEMPLLSRRSQARQDVLPSIREWLRRTQEETSREPLPPARMSEPAISSYWEGSTETDPTREPAPRRPPARTPQRRFTVMNQ